MFIARRDPTPPAPDRCVVGGYKHVTPSGVKNREPQLLSDQKNKVREFLIVRGAQGTTNIATIPLALIFKRVRTPVGVACL
jgi:hypothetical protein